MGAKRSDNLALKILKKNFLMGEIPREGKKVSDFFLPLSLLLLFASFTQSLISFVLVTPSLPSPSLICISNLYLLLLPSIPLFLCLSPSVAVSRVLTQGPRRPAGKNQPERRPSLLPSGWDSFGPSAAFSPSHSSLRPLPLPPSNHR